MMCYKRGLYYKSFWIRRICISLVFIYTSYAILTWTYVKQPRQRNLISNKPSQTIVILFTNKRSGSTLLGELFNTNPDAFYVFEPLFPFTRVCNELKFERVAALKQFLNCNFADLHNIYRDSFEVTRHSDKFANCMENNICFADRQKPLLDKYKSHCLKSNLSSHCGMPLNGNFLSSLCASSPLIVFKVLRICEMETMQEIFNNISQKSSVAYRIVHLIRDPRAILTSRLKLPTDDTGQSGNELIKAAHDLCTRLRANTAFADIYWKEDNKVSTSYMRIRHEDITRWPFQSSQEIYEFIGHKIPIEVYNTIKHSITSEDGITDPFKITRRSNEVLNKWRRELSLEQVQTIQNQCSDIMSSFNYKMVNSLSELRDENMTLW